MTEREMEDLLWEYPDRFLNEPLKQFRRQPSSPVGRPDLVFEDGIGGLLIVEVKRGQLPRGAVPQLVDYFGIFKKEFPNKAVEMMVVANSIPPERALACQNHFIECREIPERRFRQIAEEVGYEFKSESQAASQAPQDLQEAQRHTLGLGRHVGPPRKVEKAWSYSEALSGRRVFLAFVNQKGNCSMRIFDAGDGTFLERRYGPGNYQEAFRDYWTQGTPISLSQQPNLEKVCKPRLPSSVLAELQRQIPASRRDT